jgi:catechol 2,3-dioxygenase-like lactoylglutathione lyase family enzyme
MLASSKVIGFVPTKDSAQARSFYEGKLGFQFVSDDMFALVMRAGETTNHLRNSRTGFFRNTP